MGVRPVLRWMSRWTSVLTLIVALALIPGKVYAPRVPAQQLTCYLPSGAPDPTPPWEGAGVPEGANHRLFPPVSAVAQAPWIADLANLGRTSGVPTPQDIVSSAINAWLRSAMSNMDKGLAGFFGSMTDMPLLVHVPIVLQGFAASLVLALMVAMGRFAMDLHRWSRGDPVADRPDGSGGGSWRRSWSGGPWRWS